MKVIITGVTGMVGEGVLLACLEDSRVTEVLSELDGFEGVLEVADIKALVTA